MHSETRFLLKFLWSIILLPFRFMGRVFGKKTKLSEPFDLAKQFFLEAKTTAMLIIILLICFFISIFLPEQFWLNLAQQPSDLFDGRWWTLITTGFLHGGLVHLFGNLLALFVFGRIVEREVKGQGMLIVYFGSLIISGLFTSIIHYLLLGDNTPGIGASGAIMGVVAAAMLLRPFEITYVVGIPLPVTLAGWLYIIADVTALLQGTQDGVGHFAHLGGFLAITLIAPLLRKQKESIKKGWLVNAATLFIAILFLFLSLR